MTWKQFKEAIEAAGTKDEDHVFHIDTGDYPKAEDLNIHIELLEDDSRQLTVS